MSWQHRAEIALASAMDACQTITYAELADAAAIPKPNRINKLTAWLEDTMRIDYAAEKPLRLRRLSRAIVDFCPGFFMFAMNLVFTKVRHQDSKPLSFTRRLSMVCGLSLLVDHQC